MVWQASSGCRSPSSDWEHYDRQGCLEFLIVGARAVQVGTAHFIHPHAAIDILEGIEDYLEQHQFDDINQLIGTLKTGGETC